MKKLILILAMSMVTPVLAQQAQIKLSILDSWTCGEDVCSIAIDPDKRLVLLLSDKYGLYSISHHGKVLWKRKDM